MIKSFVKYKKIKFPAGEMHVQLLLEDDVTYPDKGNVEWLFESTEEIMEILLLSSALKQHGYKIDKLIIPYFPFSRQDRVANYGDCFSLKVMCGLINQLGAEEVVTHDPHSDVLPALLDNVYVVHQSTIFYPMLNSWFSHDDNVILISPDAGALKKIYRLSKESFKVKGVVECSKLRNTQTGDITGVKVNAPAHELDGKTCVMVDDICDGGRTFIEIAKEIRLHHAPKKIVLMVTHGIFSKGLEVFDGIIDEVWTREGMVPLLSKQHQKQMDGRAV